MFFTTHIYRGGGAEKGPTYLSNTKLETSLSPMPVLKGKVIAFHRECSL